MLHDFMPPKNELFIPRNKTSKPAASSHVLIQPPSLYSHSPGNATPIPEPSLASSPAWDPSSRTPQPNSDDAESLPSPNTPPSPVAQGHAVISSSSPTPQPDSDNAEPLPRPDQGNVLLDVRLLGAQLKVSVTGGKFDHKEITASVISTDGRLSIQRRIYKSLQTLHPDWVTPKHPNPTRDNGLLVVIKGDHCGKYVRRIHHRYEGEKAVVTLAVVNRVAGHVDSLTGEQLGLDVSHLCVCDEPKVDKGLNTSLMDSLREDARKTRAK